jgi:hypothetical protein
MNTIAFIVGLLAFGFCVVGGTLWLMSMRSDGD